MKSTEHLLFWFAIVVSGTAVMSRNRRALAATARHYFRWLSAPWKVATFVAAAIGLTTIAPLMGDPTWDRVDAAFMSTLTFVTAPWAVGAVWRFVKGRGQGWEAYLAVCLALFSASGSYDLYLLGRDGVYPASWLDNLMASMSLYTVAGLFWNLDWKAGRGVTFAFCERVWPDRGDRPAFRRVWIPATALMAVVGGTLMVPFLW